MDREFDDDDEYQQAPARPQKSSALFSKLKQDATSTFQNLRAMAKGRLNGGTNSGTTGSNSSIHKQVTSKKLVFGRSLLDVDRGADGVPLIIRQTVDYLSQNADQVGLFRISGSLTEVKALKEQYDSGTPPTELKDVSPHTVASLLKMYLRELPEPLATFELYDMFIAANTINVPQARLECIKKIISMLPGPCMAVLIYLTRFLRELTKYSDINKMTAANLAVVFAPNLLRHRDLGLEASMTDTAHASQIMETLINKFDYLLGDIDLNAMDLNSNSAHQSPLVSSQDSPQLQDQPKDVAYRRTPVSLDGVARVESAIFVPDSQASSPPSLKAKSEPVSPEKKVSLSSSLNPVTDQFKKLLNMGHHQEDQPASFVTSTTDSGRPHLDRPKLHPTGPRANPFISPNASQPASPVDSSQEVPKPSNPFLEADDNEDSNPPFASAMSLSNPSRSRDDLERLPAPPNDVVAEPFPEAPQDSGDVYFDASVDLIDESSDMPVAPERQSSFSGGRK